MKGDLFKKLHDKLFELEYLPLRIMVERGDLAIIASYDEFDCLTPEDRNQLLEDARARCLNIAIQARVLYYMNLLQLKAFINERLDEGVFNSSEIVFLRYQTGMWEFYRRQAEQRLNLMFPSG